MRRQPSLPSAAPRAGRLVPQHLVSSLPVPAPPPSLPVSSRARRQVWEMAPSSLSPRAVAARSPALATGPIIGIVFGVAVAVAVAVLLVLPFILKAHRNAKAPPARRARRGRDGHGRRA